MAEYNSRGEMTTFKCMKCDAEMSVSIRRKIRMDGRNCFLCKGPIHEINKRISAGSFALDIDCSKALTGLKSIQREVRKTTAALKEFEEAYNTVKAVAEQCGVDGQELLSLLTRSEVKA